MAEHSKFFDSLNPLDPDKVYTADEFIDYFEKLITTGIMKGEANMLKVETSGSNMNTTVDTGAAYLNGRLYENDAKLSLTHEVEALGKSRIDRVVVRLVLDVDARYIKAFVKKGVAGASPIAPPLERTGDVYEISLAQVKVIGGQTYINVADVTDERGQEAVCPWAGSKILPNFDNATLEEHIHDYLEHTPFVKTTGTGSEYQVTLDGITHLYEGLSLAINVHVNNVDTPFLKINNLARKVITINGEFLQANTMLSNGIYTLRYNGNNFLVQGAPAVKLNNTLTSTSTTEAASASVAKLLNDKITAIENRLNM